MTVQNILNTNFCSIILRDVPKEKARIDADTYEIEGGFRGFTKVMPGLHYVGVQVDETYQGFWSYLEPNEVLVKVFNHASQQFEDDEPETKAHYQRLALAGAMDQVLIPYNYYSWEIWDKLTNYINSHVFSQLISDTSSNIVADNSGNLLLGQQQSRFEQILFNKHNGDIATFLGEFQFAFVRWYINIENVDALSHWRYLLQAVYNAGESGIAKAPELFTCLIDILLAQFDCLPEDMFTSESFITAQSSYLAEDMIDSDIDGVVEKGQHFEAYLQNRMIRSD
jgi:hypothetical protein